MLGLGAKYVMGNSSSWKRIPLAVAVGLVAACGGGSGGSRQISRPANVADNLPQIVGTPTGTAVIGQLYQFTPSATDADGDTLTFRIENRPGWATFSPNTGRLEGTPGDGDAGTYSGIVITVSGGAASASLPVFTIAVQAEQTGTGSATISWTPPTRNTDNSPLTDLAGYRIHYGTSSDTLTQVLDLPNPGISIGVVENIAPGTWYFAVTSYNSSNVESERSNITSKSIG
jgi:hypothetical protein